MKNYIHKISKSFKTGMFIAAYSMLLAIPSDLRAQDSKGTDFWVMFNRNHDMSAVTLTLFITSAVNTSGTVSGPSLSSIPFTVTANTVTSVVVPTSMASHTNDVVDTKGIHITSLQDVTVYGLNRRTYSTDAYLGLPTDALGTDYTVLTYKNQGPFDFASVSFGIVGTVNGTVVTITPSVTTLTHSAGVAYNVTLNQGDTYELRNATNSAADLTRTRITSTQPVGVFGAHTCANIVTGCGYCDHICEMLPPTSTWGKKFLTVPLQRTLANGDQWKILAKDNGTTITINGVVQSPVLNAGQQMERNLTTQSVIEADKPVLVAQFAQGSTCSGNPGDPFMMLIPPYEQFFSGYTVTTVSGFTNHYINIVTPTSAAGSMTRNGVPIPFGSFTPIGASGFSGAKISVADGSHTLAGALPFGCFMYGFNTDDSYGYAGGQSYSPIALVTNLVLTAEVNNADACTNHCWNALVTDQFNNPLTDIRVDFNIYGASSANSGFAFTNGNGIANFCYTGYAGLDSIIASVSTVRDTLTFTWAPQNVVGTPTIATNSPICTGSTLTLSASASGATSYSWTGPNGFISSQQNPSIPSATGAATGTYTVAINGCVSASIAVTVSLPPTAGSNSPLCQGATLNLTSSNSSYTSWSWTGPSGFTASVQNPSLSPAVAGTYSVTVTDVYGCVSSTAVVVTVGTVTPVITASGPLTLCGYGGSVVLTASTSGPWLWNSGQTTQSINLTASGTRTVSVNGCTSAPVTFTFNAILPEVIISLNIGACEGSTLNLTVPTGGGTSFLWSGPNSFTSTNQNPSIPSVTTAAAGVYTVTVTNAIGCTRSGSATITINPVPSVNAGSDVTINNGSSTQLNATGIVATAVDVCIYNVSQSSSCTFANSLCYGDYVTESIARTSDPFSIGGAGSISSIQFKIYYAVCISTTHGWNFSLNGVNIGGTGTLNQTIEDCVCDCNCYEGTFENYPRTFTITGAQLNANWNFSGNNTLTVTPTVSMSYVAGYSAVVNYFDNIWSPTTGLSNANIANPVASPSVTTTYTATTTNSYGCSATSSVTVTVNPCNLAVNAGADEQTYYGYNLDQTVNRTATATGGGGTYSYQWTLSRKMRCNIVNSVGDEIFNSGTCTNNACPAAPDTLTAAAPSCTNTTGSVTAKLIDDADLYVLVTDQNGCTARDTFHINSIDARCFSGNSNNYKIYVCHHTGSNTNPWVQICIEQPAVSAHLAENNQDCIGLCPCGTRLDNATASSDFGMAVYPNPTSNNVNVEFDSETPGAYQLTMFDITGRAVLNNTGSVYAGGNRIALPVSGIAEGIYNIRLSVGDKSAAVRLVVSR